MSFEKASLTSAENQTLLELKDLTIQFFGQSEAVVSEVSLSLQAGEKLALVGESGSGKSVLARSILRLDAGVKVSGEIIFQDQNILQLPLAELRKIRGRKIAMIFQEPMTSL
ncbi:MAG: ATP-binding cassette domain-containing protein, partial [Deefgea sp.]